MLRIVIVACTLMVAGCAVGTNIKRLPAATSPNAVRGWVFLGDERKFEGELLSVADSQMVMQTGVKLVQIPIARIQQFKFSPFAVAVRAPTAHELSRLRSASRFPFGIPESALAALLERSGQSVIEVVP